MWCVCVWLESGLYLQYSVCGCRNGEEAWFMVLESEPELMEVKVEYMVYSV